MTPEDIKKLPTRETDGFRAFLIAHGQYGAYDKMCSLEQQRNALFKTLNSMPEIGTPDFCSWLDRMDETLASIRSMK